MEYLQILSKNAFFKNCSLQEIQKLIHCLKAEIITYHKNYFIEEAGNTLDYFLIVLKGQIITEIVGLFGERVIVSSHGENEIFGLDWVNSTSEKIGVNVIANEESICLKIKNHTIYSPCSNVCFCHSMIIKNTLSIIANHNLYLINKINELSKRSIREKVLTYLHHEAQKQNKKDFYIPFNRQELADYLSVDRAALSKELSKMQKEKILCYQKNHFVLL